MKKDYSIPSIKDKRSMLSSILFNIYGSKCVSYSKISCNSSQKAISRKNNHMNEIKFTNKSRGKQSDLFDYTFLDPTARYIDTSIEFKRGEVFRKAFDWLNLFFDLKLDAMQLIDSNDLGENREVLTEWGKKLQQCYAKMLDVLFDNKESGKNITININEIRNRYKEEIQILLSLDSISDDSALRKYNSVFDDGKVTIPSDSQIISFLDSMQSITKRLPKTNFLNEENHTMLPSKDKDEFVKGINNSISILNKLKEPLNLKKQYLLYDKVLHIDWKTNYFKNNLDLKLKEKLLKSLESIKTRFFEDRSIYSEYYNGDTISTMLSNSIYALKLLINDEKKKNKKR